MRKLVLILLAVTLPLAAGAQKMNFGVLQEKYAERDGYTVIEITQAMLGLLGKSGKNVHVNNMIGAIDGIKHLTIIIAEDASAEFTNDVKSVIGKGSGYNLLTSIKENGQNILFHYKSKPGSGDVAQTISELTMVIYGSDDNLIVRIQGSFSIKQITSAVDSKTQK